MPEPSIKSVLCELVKGLRSEAQGLRAHFRDVLGISPEVAHLDAIVLEGTVTSSTSITQPTSVRVPADYDFELFGIGACISNPSDTTADAALVSFNIREQGRNFDIFTSNVPLQQFVSTTGPNAPLLFERGLYKFSAGSDIKGTLYAKSGWGGGAKYVWVTLLGNMIRK